MDKVCFSFLTTDDIHDIVSSELDLIADVVTEKELDRIANIINSGEVDDRYWNEPLKWVKAYFETDDVSWGGAGSMIVCMTPREAWQLLEDFEFGEVFEDEYGPGFENDAEKLTEFITGRMEVISEFEDDFYDQANASDWFDLEEWFGIEINYEDNKWLR